MRAFPDPRLFPRRLIPQTRVGGAVPCLRGCAESLPPRTPPSLGSSRRAPATVTTWTQVSAFPQQQRRTMAQGSLSFGDMAVGFTGKEWQQLDLEQRTLYRM
ncbi:PREDICTED: zinc finger protein 585B-like [Rhinopithecus bieti]|uniref:zinc finger protein 585B-like n=1 Tax=Rhinopithecus bieti TaxID=61621 RepID=UPI00083BC54F|nr:PREDICTED: zinc finger protein 585B-like [Rhinopithecus bieti]